jgi:methyl-accepting chemotaxis protein
MLRADRVTRAWRAVLSDRSANAHIRLLSRLAGATLALLLVLAVGTSVLTWTQTAALRTTAYPALNDLRQLDALLVSTRDAIRLDDAPGLSRADSVADQFHRLADAAQRRPILRDAVLAADGEFRAYYAQARHWRSSADHRVEAAGDGLAEITFRALRAQLDAVQATQRREMDDAYASLRQLQVVTGVAMALVVLAAIALFAALAGNAAHAVAQPMADAVRCAQRLAEGELDVELRAGDSGTEGALHRALACIAGVMRANRTAAEELAAGEYRIGTHEGVPDDRTGRALARVSAYLDYLSIAAQRVAEGDLTAAVEPRSADDTLGHAYAMMLQRIASIVREFDATAQLVAATAADVRRAAAELATGTTDEASTARHAVEQLASISSELGNSAARAADLERRTMETAAAMDEGTVVLRESHDTLQRVLRRATVVDDIAREAGLIALNTGIEVGRAGAHGTGFVAIADEVRALATEAADASREIGALTVHGTDAATRSTAILARVVPALARCVSLVRELSATSGQRATELAQAHREITATGDARRRSTAAAEALGVTAELLAGQAERLLTMLAQFHGARDGSERDAHAAPRRPSLRHNAAERRGAIRRLALV